MMRSQRIITGAVLLAEAASVFVLVGCSAARVPSSDAFSLRSFGIASSVPTVGIPHRLRIPDINVDAVVEEVGLTQQGDMDVPSTWDNTGWYKNGPRPGEKGNAVIDGHLDSYTSTAVFWNIKKLQPDDEIFVDDGSGHTLTFRVTGTQSFAALTEAGKQAVFGKTDGVHLNLVTCGGTWDKKSQHYTERLVVFSELES